MNNRFVKSAIAAAVMFNLALGGLPLAYAATPNPDDVPALSVPVSHFNDFEQVSDYAKKAVVRLELLGLFNEDTRFFPQQHADKIFLRSLLGTLDDLGNGEVTYAEAKQLITHYLIQGNNGDLSFEGFLSKKDYQSDDRITREDLAYLVAHAREANVIDKGLPIHNPAIATTGPLLGPTVYQSGSDNNGPIYDGSTVSLFHRGRMANNTTFKDAPVYTLQVHPEVFKSVSVGGIKVSALQDLSAQLEVELIDGSLHRTPLTSLVPFSIHGADGKAGEIRIEDGLLVLADDLLGNVDRFSLNGHEFSVDQTINRINLQSYYNGDKTSGQVVSVVNDGLVNNGFTLQDRRLMAHNLILSKTALQQSKLSPLSAPFNTIAGPGSDSRNFKEGHLYTTYQLTEQLRGLVEAGNTNAIRDVLNDVAVQQKLLTGAKILTATTLLPHITALSNAAFLPNEALSSRVKKSGALLPSEPISFQFDRLKRAAYVLLDDALSAGTAAHLVTHGEIIQRQDTVSQTFTLSAGNFEAVPLITNQSALVDAIYDYSQAYEELVRLISGFNYSGSLTELSINDFSEINSAFSRSILSPQMAKVKIGKLEFKLDLLATASHVLDNFSPANVLTQSRQTEAFGLNTALQPFPVRLAQYICTGNVVTESGELIAKSKLDPQQQGDLLSDISNGLNTDCLSTVEAPRYQQLLFVDNFQLPPFGPKAKFISTQGIEIINRLLFSPVEADLPIADIRLSYRLTEAELNKAPVAVIEGPGKAKLGQFITLNAGLSSDNDGDALQYQWKVKSGHAIILQSRTLSKAYLIPGKIGDLVIALEVNDGTANSKTIEKNIRVVKNKYFSFSRFLYNLFH